MDANATRKLGRTSRKRFVCPNCIIFLKIYAVQIHRSLDKLHILWYNNMQMRRNEYEKI